MICAEDYLRANETEPFSLHDLAEATGASGRMLEYHFQRIYGVGPGAWFRSMKLNGVHRDLLSKDGGQSRISDIAMKWGFLHLGRFAREYSKLFGETPSTTQRRTS